MAKTFTSASANKFIKGLEDEKSHLLAMERDTSVYILAEGEAAEPPVYDYADTRAKVQAIDDQVRAVRHALHAFNAVELLPEAGISIDEALVELAQLNNLKGILSRMRSQQPRERVTDRYYRTDQVEYRYANYDIAQAQADYAIVSERISTLQLELDLVNQTHPFEVEL